MEDTEGRREWVGGSHQPPPQKSGFFLPSPLQPAIYISMSIVLLGTTSDSADASA